MAARRAIAKRLLATSCLLTPLCSPAFAEEIFVLAGDSRIEGVWVNRDESPRTDRVVVDLPGGIRVTLPRESVAGIVPVSPVDREYERLRTASPDTIDGHLLMARWCGENKMRDAAARHYERIIEIDPEHELARVSLGYSKRSDGAWSTRDEFMRSQGYIMHAGDWKFPQEITIAEEQDRIRREEGQWRQNIQLWRRWLDGSRSEEALRSLSSIRDPMAVGPLSELLAKEGNERVRRIYLAALHQIGSPMALVVLTDWSFHEPLDELRRTCWRYMQGDSSTIDYLISQLFSPDNHMVNEAALTLRYVGDQRVIPPLIQTLRTTHVDIVTKGSPGRTGASFGSGGTSMQMGTSTVKVERTLDNADVLSTLKYFTEGVDFGYDAQRWKAWWRDQRRLDEFNPRRGGFPIDSF